MLKFRSQHSTVGCVLLIIWLCIKCGDATSESIPLKLTSLNFELIKHQIISASGLDKEQNLTGKDLQCKEELNAIENGVKSQDIWALKSKFG